MHIRSIQTHRIDPSDSLQKILDQYLVQVVEGDIVVMTSKILSLMQRRVVAKDAMSKYDLVRQESDAILRSPKNPYDLYLTIKNGILIPSAGIDESNADDVYVLYPKDIQKTAEWMWRYLREKYEIQNLGIVITDSHTTIMRRGVTGIALGWCGFAPLYSYINKPDLYGKPLRVTQMNILDALATAAVFVMGEGDEKTPFAIIQNAPKITFLDRPPAVEEEQSITIPLPEDLYAPLLQAGTWLKH